MSETSETRNMNTQEFVQQLLHQLQERDRQIGMFQAQLTQFQEAITQRDLQILELQQTGKDTPQKKNNPLQKPLKPILTSLPTGETNDSVDPLASSLKNCYAQMHGPPEDVVEREVLAALKIQRC